MSVDFTRTSRALDDGIRQGLHSGGQVWVCRGGEPLLDRAFGEARPGEPMRRDHLMLWLSSSKPVTAIAIAQLWERELLRLDDPVAHFVPEFAAHGKDGITLRHLLTHTSGIRMLDVGWPDDDWDAIVARICSRRPEPRWPPGRKAGYHLTSSWFLLAEVVRRLDGRDISTYVRDEIFEPLGLEDCWIGMPRASWEAYGSRLAPVYSTAGDAPESHQWESEARVTRPSPGGNGWGPIHQLGRLYQVLLDGGRAPGHTLLAPQTVEALTARHRVGLVDHTFKRRLDWGLGVILDSKHYAESEVPYGYGPYASHRTFGHSGYRSSTAFADPEHALVVALAVNGTPDDPTHLARFERLAGAIYEDLGLAG